MTFLHLSRIALSHFSNTLYSNMDSISSLMHHTIYCFCFQSHFAWPPCSFDRIPSTTPGAEPPRDARDSGSARSHSTHLETSSSDRPKMVTYTEPQTVPSYMSVTCTRRTLCMPNFTRAMHAQPSPSKFLKWDSNFGEPTHSRGIFPLPPKIKLPKSHIVRYTCQFEQ